MDLGKLNLALKLIQEEYKLTAHQVTTLSHRLMADDKEFARLWEMFKDKANRNGVDKFKEQLQELLS